ncbi:MAG TPA: hypothetical protein VNW46_12135 [Gemmatimonadaceae bacterium]|nr:hypothetical protein [Gemmatimonadaceae bacterium]
MTSTQRPAAPSERHKSRHWGLIAFGALVVLPAAFIALYTWATLSWTYSSGERVGYVQKFSQKGYVCKTWEGELTVVTQPGIPPTTFAFTVRDDSVAAAINAQLGKRVALEYRQHKGVPTSCFGETEYYVSGVKPAGL